MRSRLRGNTRELRAKARQIQGLERGLVQAVAADSTSALTSRAREAYVGGKTVYGAARPAGVAGQFLSLVKTGATLGSLYFAAAGGQVRARFGTDYARYLIGKYRILPIRGLPSAWRKAIAEATTRQLTRRLA